MTKFKIIIGLLTIVSFGCYNKNSNNTSEINSKIIYHINNDNDESLFKMDSAFSLEKVVPLESSLNSNIGILFKGIVYEDKFYMHDFINNNLLVYNSNGKFIHKVGRRGKGPEEYLELRDFMISGNCVYTLDYKKIHCFSIDSDKYNFSVPIKINEFNPCQMIVFNKNTFYLWQTNPEGWKTESKQDKYRLIKVKNGRVVKKYFKFSTECLDDQRFFECSDGSFFIKPILGDFSVYNLSKDDISTSFFIDFKNKSLPKGYINDHKTSLNDCFRNSYYKSPRKIFETKNFIYFNCIGPGSFLYEGLINKKTKSIYFGKSNYKYSPTIFYSDGTFFYGYYEPAALLSEQSGSTDKLFQTVVNRLNGNINLYDNIVVVKLSIR